MKNIRLWVVVSAVLGPAISFNSLYFFHIVAAIFVLLVGFKLFSGGRITVSRKILLLPVFFMGAYFFVSVLWHPSISTWLRYNIYFLLGIVCIVAVYQESSDLVSLSRVFRVMLAFVFLDLALGLVESFGWARFPISRYSEYASYFGYPAKDFSVVSEAGGAAWEVRPSGFNFNTNNFGFVLMIFSPFLLLKQSLTIKTIGFAVLVWLILSIDSKAHYLAFSIMLFAYFFWYVRLRFRLVFAVVVPLMCIFLLVLDAPGIYYSTLGRSFDAIFNGAELLASGEFLTNDSTSIRAAIYMFGVQELIKTHGLGLGFGGVEALLIQNNFDITTFHFLFLQLLVDLGVICFSVFSFFYVYLIFKLYKIFKSDRGNEISYFAGASSLGLIVAVPASIGPSATHYILPFYIFVGFALSVIKVGSVVR